MYAFHVVEGGPAATLPVLATASDVREVVQFLKKKPDGVTVVEASDTVRRRLFDYRKLAAYEVWGIISKVGDRIRLSELGREFATKLEPETQIYRVILDTALPYRAVLEWIYQQNIDVVTFADIVDYWQEHFPEALQQSEKASESQVVSFLHLCHAAEIGVATVGRKGQPSRLRLDHDELAEYVAGSPRSSSKSSETEESQRNVQRPVVFDASPRRHAKAFVSTPGETGIAGDIQAALQALEIDGEVVQREMGSSSLVSERAFQAMQRCEFAIIVVGHDDWSRDAGGNDVLKQSTLIEIGSALVHFARRVVLINCTEVPLPFTGSFHHLDADEHALTWEIGLRLIKIVKLLRSDSKPT